VLPRRDCVVAGDRSERKAAADGLAVARKVRDNAVLFLRAAPRDTKPGDDLVEYEHDAVLARDVAHRLEKTGLGEQHALQRLDDDCGELLCMAFDNLPSARRFIERMAGDLIPA